MKYQIKEKGITLVALVITIIILLILTGVTINTALSENGLFKRSKTATEKYQESEKQEQTALKGIAEEMDKISIDYNDFVGAYVDYEPTKRTFKISKETSGVEAKEDTTNKIDVEGNQTFTTEEDMKWKIWDYDKYSKTIRLISSKPTDATLTLNGATGYNNGVYAINEVCRQCYGQYNENGEMKRGITVANLRRTDIQKISKYDYTQYKYLPDGWEESTDGTVHFGDSKTYTENNKYPAMWKNFDSQWTYEYNGGTQIGSDKECEMLEKENGYETVNDVGTGNKDTEFKQSYYAHDYLNHQEQFINKEYYNLLFNYCDDKELNNVAYWLAGRCVHLSENYCTFEIQRVNADTENCYVYASGLYTSNR